MAQAPKTKEAQSWPAPGAEGGAGGGAGNVVVNTLADITTLGANSRGFIAQSIGGGGGTGGSSISKSESSAPDNKSKDSTETDSTFSLGASVGTGGAGGSGGNAGDVDVNFGGTVLRPSKLPTAFMCNRLVVVAA